MERVWKIACGALSLLAVAAGLALGPIAASADDGSVNAAGGSVLTPAYQVGNAQGDGNGL
jgi:hypothetical protein